MRRNPDVVVLGLGIVQRTVEEERRRRRRITLPPRQALPPGVNEPDLRKMVDKNGHKDTKRMHAVGV